MRIPVAVVVPLHIFVRSEEVVVHSNQRTVPRSEICPRDVQKAELEAFRFAVSSIPNDGNSASGRATLTSVLAGFVTLVLQPPLLLLLLVPILLDVLLLRPPLPLLMRTFFKRAELRAVETTTAVAASAVIVIAVGGSVSGFFLRRFRR